MASRVQQTGNNVGWAGRLGRGSFNLAIFSLVVAAAGLTLARYDVIAKIPGFFALLIGGAVAFFALTMAVASLLIARTRRFQSPGKTIAALVVSLLYVGFLGSRPLMADDTPAIHDVTTDLANPPRFESLPLRTDNLAGVGTLDNWRRIHAQAYADLRPVTIAKPVPVVTANAVRLAREAGWKVVASDLTEGHVEATASVSYIRFHDDVVIRVEPIAAGTGSRVDMRSVSRVGGGDLGVNARRIRNFLIALAAA